MMTFSRRSGSAVVIAGFASALVLLSVSAARAQTSAVDQRWTPWLGCWSPDASLVTLDWNRNRHVCVVPASASAVDIVSIADGKMQSRERIDADGAPHPVVDCSGTYRATWSPSGRQLFVKAESVCADRPKTSVSRIFAFSASGHWLDVSSVEATAGAGVHTVRYRPAYGPSPALPAGLAADLQARVSGIEQARSVASAPVRVADVAAVARLGSAAALQGWLVANGLGFELNPKSLVTLADARVPDTVIDVMVALTFPDTFSLQAEQAGRRRTTLTTRSAGGGGIYCENAPGMSDLNSLDCALFNTPWWSSLTGNYGVLCVPVSTATSDWLRCSRGYDGFGAEYSLANSLYMYPYHYRYYGATETFYLGQNPFVVVPGGSAPTPPTAAGHGRVVNGRGYTQGGTESSGQPVAANSPAPSAPASAPSSSGAESSAPASVPSSSGGERTAHPR
jgi:hypothetical protein